MTDAGSEQGRDAERDAQRDRDLAGRAMAAIDQLVDTVHDRVIRPVLLIGRTIAFAFIIVFAVLVVAVAMGVAVMRLLNVYLFSGHEWASWALIGGLSLGAGLWIWRRRRAVPTRPATR